MEEKIKVLRRKTEPYEKYNVKVSSVNPLGTVFGTADGLKGEYAFTEKKFEDITPSKKEDSQEELQNLTQFVEGCRAKKGRITLEEDKLVCRIKFKSEPEMKDGKITGEVQDE